MFDDIEKIISTITIRSKCVASKELSKLIRSPCELDKIYSIYILSHLHRKQTGAMRKRNAPY